MRLAKPLSGSMCARCFYNSEPCRINSGHERSQTPMGQTSEVEREEDTPSSIGSLKCPSRPIPSVHLLQLLDGQNRLNARFVRTADLHALVVADHHVRAVQ